MAAASNATVATPERSPRSAPPNAYTQRDCSCKHITAATHRPCASRVPHVLTHGDCERAANNLPSAAASAASPFRSRAPACRRSTSAHGTFSSTTIPMRAARFTCLRRVAGMQAAAPSGCTSSMRVWRGRNHPPAGHTTGTGRRGGASKTTQGSGATDHASKSADPRPTCSAHGAVIKAGMPRTRTRTAGPPATVRPPGCTCAHTGSAYQSCGGPSG